MIKIKKILDVFFNTLFIVLADLVYAILCIIVAIAAYSLLGGNMDTLFNSSSIWVQAGQMLFVVVVTFLILNGLSHYFKWFVLNNIKSSCTQCENNVVAARKAVWHPDEYISVNFSRFGSVLRGMKKLIQLQKYRPMMYYKCPTCGHEEYICPYCHKPVEKYDDQCPHCKNKIVRHTEV